MPKARQMAVAAGLAAALLGGVSFVASQQLPPGAASPGALFPGLEGSVPETLNQVDPQLRVDGPHIYRLWTDEWAGRGRRVRFQRSADGGTTWLQDPLKLDRGEPENAQSTSPAFTHDGTGRVMAIWRTSYPEGGGRREIRFLASPDRGVSWPGPAISLSRSGGAFAGDVSADGRGHVYAVWYEERIPAAAQPALRATRGALIALNRSDDFGKTWLPEPIELSGTPRPDGPREATGGTEASTGGRGDRRAVSYLSFQPRIQSDVSGRVFVTWLDTREGPSEVFVRVSPDHGKSWGPEINVSRGARNALNHQLLTDGAGRAFLVWSDARDGREDVFFSRSENGQTWDEPRRLSRRPTGLTSSVRPHMARGPEGHLYVAWVDRRNGRDDIYFNASPDAAKTWLDRAVRLDRDDEGTGVSREPFVVAVGRRGVAVLWQDDRTGFEQILMNRSADGGRTWLPAELRVDTTTGARRRALTPRAAWSPAGRLHVVWEVWEGEGLQAQRRVGYAAVPLQP